jgi:biopolymer transport protein TolQ
MQSDLNILKIILSSGLVVQSVLLSLIVASLASWGIILKKRKESRTLGKNNQDFLQIYMSADNLKDVMSKAEILPFSPFKEMFVEGYSELSKIKSSLNSQDKGQSLDNHFRSYGLTALERALKKGANSANVKMDSMLSTLASIGSISPFVGLFGTVWGIINSFQGLAGGGATIDAVAPGIAEALVATAVGLAAAIPAVWFYNEYSTKNSVMNSDMENFAQEFLNVVERSLLASRG